MRIAIYARVSTKDQQTIPMQIEDLKDYARLRKWTVSQVFEEKVSGASSRRPQYSALMNQARQRKIDGILVWKIDRWGRNSRDIINSLHELDELKVKFISFQESLDLTTPNGRAMAQMIAVFANLEKDLIGERVKAGVAQAKKNGVHMGRPKKIDEKIIKKAKALQEKGYTHTKIMNELKLGKGTVYKILGNSSIKKGRPFKNKSQVIEDGISNNKKEKKTLETENLPAFIPEVVHYAEITEDKPKDEFDREVESLAEYRNSEDGIYEEFAHEKNIRLSYNPDFYCDEHKEYYRIRNYLFQKEELTERGWNKGAIKKFLGSPNFVVYFKYYSPAHFWFKKDVLPWESKQEFKSFLEKSKISQEKKKEVEAEKRLKFEQEQKVREEKEQEKIKKYTLDKKKSGKKIARIRLDLRIENNSKFVRMRGKVIKEIRNYVLRDFDYEEEDDTTFILKIEYKTEKELNETMEDLMQEIWHTADLENCFSESDATEIDGERSW